MSRTTAATAMILGLLSPLIGRANPVACLPGMPVTGTYYLVPLYPIPIPPACVLVPPPTAPAAQAVPTPAAPSSTPKPKEMTPKSRPSEAAAPPGESAKGTGAEQPQGPRAAVQEIRPFRIFRVPPDGSLKLQPGRVSAAFWNLTDAELTIQAGGQSRVVPRGESVTLELQREFEWQVAGRPVEKQKVPMTDAGVEIVIRE